MSISYQNSDLTESKVYYSNTRHQFCMNWALLSLGPIEKKFQTLYKIGMFFHKMQLIKLFWFIRFRLLTYISLSQQCKTTALQKVILTFFKVSLTFEKNFQMQNKNHIFFHKILQLMCQYFVKINTVI